MSGPRIALIGARRSRQGLGPYVARNLREAGAELAGVLGTSADSAAEAARALGAAGCPPLRGYTDLRRLVEREAPDALAILSPHATHEAYLRLALEAKLHVLCEKPFIHGVDGLGARAAQLVDGFARAQLLLHENCQWPEVLPSYYALFPEREQRAPRSFSMQLSPVAENPGGMLADSLSHPLSLVQALCPDPAARIADPRFEWAPRERGVDRREPPRLRIAFGYVASSATLQVGVELRPCLSVPRPAALALDGDWAQREVREPDYQIHLTASARSVKVPDPLAVLVGRFVAELRAVLSGRRPAASREVAHRMCLFESVERALRESGLGAA